MKRTAVIAIVTAVVIGAVTAALAIAETGRPLGARQIPTVVTGQQAVAPIVEQPQASVDETALPVPADPADAAMMHSTPAPTVAEQASSEQPATVPDVSASDSEGDEAEREVVTPRLRDFDDESSSDDSESDHEDSRKPSSDSDHRDSNESDAKN